MNAICKPKGFNIMTKRTPVELSTLTAECLQDVLTKRPENSTWRDNGSEPVERRMRKLVVYCLGSTTSNPEVGQEQA